MSERRLISRSFGSSSKLLSMYESVGTFADFAALLFQQLVIACDDHAHFHGDAKKCMMDVNQASALSGVHSEGDFERALQLLNQVGLIHLYEVEGKRYLEIVNFHREQRLKYIKKALYPAPDGKIPVAPAKKEPSDERNKPLKKYCDERWQAVRGCKLTSATNKKDWNQFATMLKRTRNDEAMTLEALQTSLDNFLQSKDQFDQKQGFAYWCANVTKYLNPALPNIQMPRRIAEKRPHACLYCDDTGRVIPVKDQYGRTQSIMAWSDDAATDGTAVLRCSCKLGKAFLNLQPILKEAVQ